MRLPVIALAVTALVVTVPPAGAGEQRKSKKPSTACLGLTDPAGDTVFGPTPVGDAYDIVRGNVLPGRRPVVAMLETADPVATDAAPSVLSGEWRLSAMIHGVPYQFSVQRNAWGTLVSTAKIGDRRVEHEMKLVGPVMLWRVKHSVGRRVDAMDLTAETTLGGDEAQATLRRRADGRLCATQE